MRGVEGSKVELSNCSDSWFLIPDLWVAISDVRLPATGPCFPISADAPLLSCNPREQDLTGSRSWA